MNEREQPELRELVLMHFSEPGIMTLMPSASRSETAAAAGSAAGPGPSNLVSGPGPAVSVQHASLRNVAGPRSKGPSEPKQLLRSDLLP